MRSLEQGAAFSVLSHQKFYSHVAQFLPENDRDNFAQTLPLSSHPSQKEIRKYFRINNERRGPRCPTRVHSFVETYEENAPQEMRSPRFNDQESVGFIVQALVPFPYRSGVGFDLTVEKWIRKYMEAGRASFSSVHRNLRLLIGLNIKEDVNDQITSTAQKIDWVVSEAKRLNQLIDQKGWPAQVIPLSWGLVDGLTPKLCSVADRVSSHIPFRGNQHASLSVRFPFREARKTLLESKQAHSMAQSLYQSCKNVYVLFSDADVIDVKETMHRFKSILSEKANGIYRISSLYCYDKNEISSILGEICPELTFFETQQSIALTLLLRTLDNVFRYLSFLVPGATIFYPPEPCTAIALNQLFPNWEYFMHLLNIRSYTDVSPAYTEASTERQKEKIILSTYPEDVLIADAPSILSARKDIVAAPGKKNIRYPKHLKVGISSSSQPDELRRLIKAQSNHQLKRSQVNSRFIDAGLGKKTFHRLLENTPDDWYYFLFFFLPRADKKGLKRPRMETDDKIKEFKKKIMFDLNQSNMAFTWNTVFNHIKSYTIDHFNYDDCDFSFHSKLKLGKRAKKLIKPLSKWVVATNQLLEWGTKIFYWIMTQKPTTISDYQPVEERVPLQSLDFNTVQEEEKHSERGQETRSPRVHRRQSYI